MFFSLHIPLGDLRSVSKQTGPQGIALIKSLYIVPLFPLFDQR